MSSEPAVFGGQRRSPLDRVLAVRIAVDWEIAAYAAIFALAFALRFWDLGARAINHDESIHAQWSWRLAQGDYNHDPVFHGPFYYHVQGLVFFVAGVSDYTSRVSAAIFGTALVALPLLLRRWLGPVGTIAAVAFIAFSPTIVFYSRFFREDIYMAFFTLLMVVAMWRYMAERRDRWLAVFALAYAGSLATKEATFLTAAVFLLYLNGQLAVDLARTTLEDRGTDSPWRRSLLAAGLFPYAWAVVALWPFIGGLRRRAAWSEIPAAGDVLVILGTLTVPLLLRFAKPVFESPPLGLWPAVADTRWDWDNVCHGRLPTSAGDARGLAGLFFAGIGATAFVGLNWRPRTWAICAGSAALVYLTLMTSFWTNLDGACTGPWGSLDYWISQHDVRRGDQPWFYYYMLMPVYEFLPLVLVLGGAYWAVVKGNVFSRFLVFWLVGVLASLSWAGEKMPWLNVHITLPACILAGWVVHRAWTSWRDRPPARDVAVMLASVAAVGLGGMVIIVFLPGGPVMLGLQLLLAALAAGLIVLAAWPHGRKAAGIVAVTAAIGALSLFSLRTMWSVSFERVDEPRDLLMYAEAGHDAPDTKAKIDALAAASGEGFNLRILVDTSLTWPWAWYLRDYGTHGAVTYDDLADGVPAGEWDVILVNRSNAGSINDFVGGASYGNPVPYTHYWWPNQAYMSALPTGPFDVDTWDRVAEGLFQDGWLGTWLAYWRDREPPGGNVTTDGLAYFPSIFDPDSGRLSFRPVEPPAPGTDSEGRLTVGGFGSQPGQFISPVDVEADASGNLYVIDSSTRKLQKFDPEGNFVKAVDVRDDPADGAEASEPWGLELLPDGRVIVADTFGWRVRILSPELEPLLSFGEPPRNDPEPGLLQLFGPRDVAVDSQGRLWVTDTGHDRIVVFSSAGEPLFAAGSQGAGPGQFDEPVGIDSGPGGRLYVADMYNARVVTVDEEGAYVGEFPVSGWGGQDAADKPYVEVLSGDRIAVSVPALNEVRVYDSSGVLLSTITGGAERLSRPYGIVQAADDSVWVSEGGAGRLRRFEIP